MILFAAPPRQTLEATLAIRSVAIADSRVTIHMAASLDGFIARKDGRADWLETSDEFADGETLDPGFVEAFLKNDRLLRNGVANV